MARMKASERREYDVLMDKINEYCAVTSCSRCSLRCSDRQCLKDRITDVRTAKRVLEIIEERSYYE